MKKLTIDSRTTGYVAPSATRQIDTPKKRPDSGVDATKVGFAPSSKVPASVAAVQLGQKQVKKSPSSVTAVLGGLGGNRLRKLGAGMAMFFGVAMLPGVALADYVKLEQNQPQIVTSAEIRPNITQSTAASEEAFNVDSLEGYALFKMFWASELPGTSQQGVWALSPEGVGHLLEYARTHNLDGEVRASPSSTDGPIDVTAGHQALVKFLLEDSYYSAFVSQEAVPLLRTAFNIPETAVAEAPQHEPVDRGTVRVCAPAEWWGTSFESWPIRDMPRALRSEYDLGARAGRYEGAASTIDQKKYELTCLLHQFGSSLNAWDDLSLPLADQVKHQIQDQILDAFFALPMLDPAQNGDAARQLRAYFASDFNGSGMGLAQSIAKGFDENSFPMNFPNASGRSSPISLSMSTSNLASAMTVLDRLRVAAGLEPEAVALKGRASVGYMVGEPSGHDKINFDERRPPIDRVNYGKMIQVGSEATGFANDPRLSSLPPTSGFTFPIDAITVTGQAVIANDATKLEVRHATTNERLTVEVKIAENSDGEPASWSLVFKTGAGAEVAPKDVVGLLKQNGRTLGDGHANQSLETGYWGRCDDNTGANTIFGRFADLPTDFVGQRDGDRNVYIRTGTTISPVPVSEARELVYMDLPGIGNTENPIDGGYRFGYDASEISWSRGTTDYKNFGLIEGFTPSPFTQTNHQFVRGDVLQINNTPREPILGMMRVETSPGSVRYINAQDVRSIIMQGDQVRVLYQNGNYESSATGKPLTDISNLDWASAPLSADPSDKTPGRATTVSGASPTETLTTAYAKLELSEAGVTLPDFLRANPDIMARGAKTVSPGDNIRIPEFATTMTSDGQTVSEIFEKLSTATGARASDLSTANRDALKAIAVPTLTVGQTLSIPVGDANMDHTVVDGETYASVLAQYATADVPAAAIDKKMREGSSSIFTNWQTVTIPAGTELTLTIPEHSTKMEGERPATLAQIFETRGLGALGLTQASLDEANPNVAQRAAGWVTSSDQLVIPERGISFSKDAPFSGDFFMRRTDGVDIAVRADEVNYIQGETPHDVRFTHYLRFVQRSEGVYGNEGSLTRSISNGRKWISDIQLHESHGADRPEWAQGKEMLGINGPLVRHPGDKIVFAAGTAKSDNYTSTTFSGWYQVDEATGRVLNEGFLSGEPDFVWGIHEANLNWNAPSTYIGGAMRSEFRIGIVVNGIPDLRNQTEEGERIATALQLPSNWKSYIVTAEQVEAHLATPATTPEGAVAENGDRQ